MRKLFLLLLILIPSLCLGQSITAKHRAVIAAMSGGVADYCSSFTPGDPADLFCEDSDGANTVETGATDWTTARGTDVGYTQTIDTGATWIEAAHSGTLSCVGKGDYAIEYYTIDAANNGSESANMEVDITDSANVYTNFYFNLVSEAMDNSTKVGLVKYCTLEGCAGRAATLSVWQDASGNLELYLEHQLADTSYVYTAGTTALSTGTWYRVGLLWEQSPSEVEVFLNGVSEIASSDVFGTNDIESVLVGTDDLGSDVNNEAVTIQIDLFAVDNDTMPGACP